MVHWSNKKIGIATFSFPLDNQLAVRIGDNLRAIAIRKYLWISAWSVVLIVSTAMGEGNLLNLDKARARVGFRQRFNKFGDIFRTMYVLLRTEYATEIE